MNTPNPITKKIIVVGQIAGVIHLARDAVMTEAGKNKLLTSAWEALDLALEGLQGLREDLEELDEQRAASRATEGP